MKETIKNIIIILCIFLNLYTYNYMNKIKENHNIELSKYKEPLNYIKILDKKIYVKDGKKTYNTEIDCTQILDSNEQIVSYYLNDSFKDSNISVQTKIYNGNKLVTDKIKKITNMETIITINKNNIEQIYRVNTACIDKK